VRLVFDIGGDTPQEIPPALMDVVELLLSSDFPGFIAWSVLILAKYVALAISPTVK